MNEAISSKAGRQWLVDNLDHSTNQGQNCNSGCSKGLLPALRERLLRPLAKWGTLLPGVRGPGPLDQGKYLVRQAASGTYPKQRGMTWTGQLRPAQAEVSQFLLEQFAKKKDCLVHAVTGAGKTEMIFPLLAEAFSQGKRAAIATPRIDVVNELFPRLSAAFGQIMVGCYHGKMEKEPAGEQLVICTTHQ